MTAGGTHFRDKAWVRNGDHFVLVNCEMKTPLGACKIPPKKQERGRTCGMDSNLPTGKSFKDYINDPNFDCRSAEARGNDVLALACNIFFESQAEHHMGQRAVAEVTVNRARQNFFDKSGGPQTIRGVVFQQSQFSWTLENVVKNSKIGAASVSTQYSQRDWQKTEKRKSWLEALSIAMSTYVEMDQGNGVKIPMISNPMLTCYEYYLSLNFFSDLKDLEDLGWAAKYYKQTKRGSGKGLEFRPICMGRHIFLRDPKARCDSRIERDSEYEEKHEAFLESFYKDCLGETKVPKFDRKSRTPANSLCDKTTLEEAICAQATGHNAVNSVGAPLFCGAEMDSRHGTGAPTQE